MKKKIIYVVCLDFIQGKPEKGFNVLGAYHDQKKAIRKSKRSEGAFVMQAIVMD